MASSTSSNQAQSPSSPCSIDINFSDDVRSWVWGPLDFSFLAIISLILQFVLFIAAPFRKSTANGMVLGLIWSAFLLADLVAYYSIGLVASGKAGSNRLYMVWMSLLLAHLSGPDSIAALDMEDHQQWSRTALNFGVVAYSTARVTFTEFGFYWATMLLLVVALIKSLERIATLVVNRTEVFQDRVIRQMNAEPSNCKLVEGAVLVNKLDNCSKRISRNRKNLSQIDIMRDAYELFQVFKGYYVDLKFEMMNEANCIREYFLDRTSEEAFEVVEIELNLMYDVFYTKASMFRKLSARLLRYFTIIAEAVFAFLIVFLSSEAEADDVDAWYLPSLEITGVLIVGGLSMDIIATLGMIFSIWTIGPADDNSFSAWLYKKLKIDSFSAWLLNKLLNIRRRTWGTQSSRKGTSCLQLLKRTLFRRWSETISQFNFIDYCLRKPPAKWRTLFFPEFKDKIRMAIYVSHQWFTDSIRNFIFEELKSKVRSLQAQGADRGPPSNSNSSGELADPIPPEFYITWMAKLKLDECLLVWHIATNLCHTDPVDKADEYFQWSKTLSNYMLYLLIHQPHMLKQSELRLMSKIRLKGAYEEAKSILDGMPSGDSSNQHAKAREKIKENWEATCEKDGMLYKGCQLADQLENTNNKWKIISKAWVLLLCRTATESDPTAHIRTLNRGGELLTIVWLLVNHLGIDSWRTEEENPTEMEVPIAEHCHIPVV